MKRFLAALAAVLTALIVLAPQCYAEFGTDELYGALPDEAREELEDSGITVDGGTEKLSIGDIWEQIVSAFTENADKPLRMFAAVIAVVLLTSLISGVSDTAGGGSGVYTLVTSVSAAAVISAYLGDIIDTARTAFTAVSDFMLTYVPVLAGVAAAGGHTASAAVYSSVTLTAIQVLSRLTSAVIIPLTGCIIGITAASGADPDLKLDRLCEGIKKFVIWGLGLIMTLFLGILSVQSIITASADNAGMKALKFAVSSAVPFVGGAVSDALSTVSGSLSVLRSGIGGFGIAACVVMLLPPVVTALLYKFLLFAAGVISDLFGCGAAGKIIKSGENAMSVILAALACFFVFMTVSSAVLLAFCRS